MVIFGVVLFYCNAIQGLLLLLGARTPELAGQTHVEISDRNAGWFLDIPGMAVLTPISNDLRRLAIEQGIAGTFAQHRGFANERIETWRPYENMERGLIPAEALADDRGLGLGIPFYYLPDIRVVDTFGLTDATVGRNLVHAPNSARYMAHDRRPPRGYLESRGVNIGVHPPANSEIRALSAAPFALKVGAGLWMPFDGIYKFDESTVAKFPEHALSTEGVVSFGDILEDLGSPVIQSDYDVYIVDNHIVYRKEICVTGQSSARRFPRGSENSEYSRPYFFLHIYPVDSDELPRYRRRYGFDNFEFQFAESGRRNNGSCVLARRLPGYAIASLYTGEFSRTGGYGIWEGHVEFVNDKREDRITSIGVERLLRSSGLPVIQSGYDVYVSGDRVIYKKERCEEDDANLPFFLHVFPINRDNLPAHRRPYGFDNLDFGFAEWGRYLEGNCVVVRDLPDYPILSIATGQFRRFSFDQPTVWQGRFKFPGQAGGGNAAQ